MLLTFAGILIAVLLLTLLAYRPLPSLDIDPSGRARFWASPRRPGPGVSRDSGRRHADLAD